MGHILNRSILVNIFLIFCIYANAQVTIGSGVEPDPDALLDLKEGIAQDANASKKGLLLPRVQLEATNLTAPLSHHVKGMLVYNLKPSGLGTTAVVEGVYYNDGTMWILGSEAADACVTDNVSFTGGITALNPITSVLGTAISVTTIAVAGNGSLLPASVEIDALGYNIAGIDLGGLTGFTPVTAASDGYLSDITVNMDVTAALTLSIGGEYNFDAYLYEAPTSSSIYQKVAGAAVSIFANEGPSTIIDLSIVPDGSYGKSQPFTPDSIKITKGNKYAIAFVLSQVSGLNIAGTIVGDISGTMSIECNNAGGITPADNHWLVAGTTDQVSTNVDNIYQMGNVGIGTENPLDVFYVDGSKDNTATPTVAQLANDFIITSSGSVGIGTADPAPSAILDVSATNKGLLGPRVALNSITDKTTIPNPAAGLLIYNTGAKGLDYVGYVFWNGSKWMTLSGGSLQPGKINAITCNGITLNPSVYKANEAFEGTMIVPYTGGNGGVYPPQTIGTINGLTATLAAGNFTVGAGSLAYTITGTPTVTTPVTTTFSINIGGATCEAVIGAEDGIVPGDLVYYSTTLNADVSNVWLSSYANDLPVLGGKLRLDAWFNATSNAGTGTVTMYPRLVNTSGYPVKFWFSAITTVDSFNASNYLIAPNGYVELDNGIYYNYGINDMLGISTPRASGSGEAGNQEVVTVDISLDNKWYRVYYFPIVDNMNTSSTADNLRQVYLSIQRLY